MACKSAWGFLFAWSAQSRCACKSALTNRNHTRRRCPQLLSWYLNHQRGLSTKRWIFRSPACCTRQLQQYDPRGQCHRRFGNILYQIQFRSRRLKIKQLTVASEQAIIFQNVQNTTRLTENEYSRALFIHGLQEFVQDDHLAGVLNQVFVRCVRRSGFLAHDQHPRKERLDPYHISLTAPSKRYGWQQTWGYQMSRALTRKLPQ